MTQPQPHGQPHSLAGPSSVAWKINGESVLLAGWARAILLQFAHPLVAEAVANHSRFLAERRGRTKRLRHTLRAMLALTFGTIDEAQRAARGINAIHDQIHGELHAPAGAFPSGTTYSAHDPALLRWVHATLLDTFPATYELLIGPLSAEEKDRYCAEASGMGPLLGVPDGYLPASTPGLRAYMNEMFAGGEIVVGDTARRLAQEVLHPPVPRVLRPLLWVAQLPTIGTLPPHIRESYGLAWTPRQERGLRLLSATSRRVLPFAPAILRFWPSARAALARTRRPETA